MSSHQQNTWQRPATFVMSKVLMPCQDLIATAKGKVMSSVKAGAGAANHSLACHTLADLRALTSGFLRSILRAVQSYHMTNHVPCKCLFLLGVRKSVATHMDLAELGRFPLQIHFWLRILRYHHRTIALDNARLVKLAMVDGFAIGQSAIGSCQHFLGEFLLSHTGEQQLSHQFDIAFIVERAKHQHALSTLQRPSDKVQHLEVL